jgi:hypothetical protein
MSSQPPESGEPEPRPETEAKQASREGREAADATRLGTPKPEPPAAKPPWWKFWAKSA